MASIIKRNGKWRALVRRKGHAAACKTHSTKAAAEAWARSIEAALDAGKPLPGVDVTVADLIHEYRRLRAAARPISDASTEHYVLRTLDRMLGALTAQRLGVDDLIAFARQRRDEGAGPYTINMDISKLATVLRYAGAARRLVLPDVTGAARPLLTHLGLIGGGGRRSRRPTQDEAERIDEYLRMHRGGAYADAVLFAAASTLRRSEFCRILWADVDESKRLVLVRDRKHPRRKAGNDEWVPLLPDAWAVLQRQPRASARVFPLDPGTVSKYFTGACRALSIPDLHLHDMRHEGTSRLFESGYDIPHAALVTGHKKWEHLQRYTNLRPEAAHKEPR